MPKTSEANTRIGRNQLLKMVNNTTTENLHK